MRWSILTPDESAHWDGRCVAFGPGVPRSEAPTEDELEDLWRSYYRSVFNPARVNPKAMRAELPVRHWATLPETRAIPGLLQESFDRARTGTSSGSSAGARPFVPVTEAVDELASAVESCRGCDLYARATQAVFGAGAAHAALMLVGEQPGDHEDLAGSPFVGPAGDVLQRAMQEAGLQRDAVYLTNAVKHFKWEPRGKRRIHQTPRLSEIRACRPWLEAEIALVAPSTIVCLGSTAAQSLMGPQFRITRDRGRVLSNPWAAALIATYHPSAVLRADNPAHADDVYRALVQDLRLAAERTAQPSERPHGSS
jgi:DNA polymerase